MTDVNSALSICLIKKYVYILVLEWWHLVNYRVRRNTASDTSESNYILGRDSAPPQTPPPLGPAELLN